MIDAHAHIGKIWQLGCPEATADRLVEYLDRIDFDKVIVSSMSGVFYDFREGNMITIEATEGYPDKILGYLALPSSRLVETTDAVEKFVKDHALAGLKIYSRVGAPVDELWMQPIAQRAAEMRIPVLAHAEPRECGRLAGARQFPQREIAPPMLLYTCISFRTSTVWNIPGHIF